MDKHHVLKQTHVGEVMVSTISLIALDLKYEELLTQLGREPLPRTSDFMGKFETMVFWEDDRNEEYRYDTVEEALKHHDELVEQVKLSNSVEGGVNGEFGAGDEMP
jgi:hypothetical protein